MSARELPQRGSLEAAAWGPPGFLQWYAGTFRRDCLWCGFCAANGPGRDGLRRLTPRGVHYRLVHMERSRLRCQECPRYLDDRVVGGLGSPRGGASR